MLEPKGLIFAIDDEPDNLALVARSLPDFEVLTFDEPLKALEALAERKPTGLIVDYKLPGMNVVELLKTCRDRGISSAALMVTAFPDLDDVVFAEQTKLVYQIITKPFKPTYLQDILQLAIMQAKLVVRGE